MRFRELIYTTLLIFSCSGNGLGYDPANFRKAADDTASDGENPSEVGVCGFVRCDGKGVQGVYVSDGQAWALTGSDGRYSLDSRKPYGYVFMVIPSGYDAPVVGGFPHFWKSLSSDDASMGESINFELVRAANDTHTMVLSADWHIAGRLNDIAELKSGYLAEMKTLDAASSEPVYELALGDLTWDSFWYSGGYYPAAWKSLNASSSHPIFTAAGNHDYDYKVWGTADDDLNASELYRKSLGPLFYSMNIGKVHYLVIDNILYDSTDGTTSGRRPKESVDAAQISWIREDLSHVSKSTPVVLAGHSPFWRFVMSGGKWKLDKVVSNAEEVLGLLSDFDDVRIFCGHRHITHFIDHAAEGFTYAASKMLEYTVPPPGGTLWTTSRYCGFNIGTDGCPAGYDILEVEGTRMKVRFKAIGEADDYQMRFYDMNEVKGFWDSDSQVAALVVSNPAYSYEKLFGTYVPNTILLNVFMGDLRGRLAKVEIFENGIPLVVSNADCFDPQHVASYDVLAFSTGGSVNSSYKSVPCTHIYRAVASSATSVITAKVTDREGRVFKASLSRPKIFHTKTHY